MNREKIISSHSIKSQDPAFLTYPSYVFHHLVFSFSKIISESFFLPVSDQLLPAAHSAFTFTSLSRLQFAFLSADVARAPLHISLKMPGILCVYKLEEGLVSHNQLKNLQLQIFASSLACSFGILALHSDWSSGLHRVSYKYLKKPGTLQSYAVICKYPF